jgi:hypothetical protein
MSVKIIIKKPVILYNGWKTYYLSFTQINSRTSEYIFKYVRVVHEPKSKLTKFSLKTLFLNKLRV